LGEVAGGRDKEEEALWVPVSTFDHILAFDHCDYIGGFIRVLKDAVIAM
jgi:hypothetical protein